jgi:hypothetical protein
MAAADRFSLLMWAQRLLTKEEELTVGAVAPVPAVSLTGTSTSVTLLRCWRLTLTWCDAHRCGEEGVMGGGAGGVRVQGFPERG